MPELMAASHLVIGRAGASTVAELAVIGRPALLVPLPHALDNDQLRNAESFCGQGGGWLMRQSELTEAAFVSLFTKLRQSPGQLGQAAAAAQRAGAPDAAERLAELVLAHARSV
jgi:UDP-N-acetylglucosamine--N-acetylmuramyl-(pentapeptide) pyrophosphoryl-undecaprenol N-acetylglucosamine transferase